MVYPEVYQQPIENICVFIVGHYHCQERAHYVDKVSEVEQLLHIKYQTYWNDKHCGVAKVQRPRTQIRKGREIVFKRITYHRYDTHIQERVPFMFVILLAQRPNNKRGYGERAVKHNSVRERQVFQKQRRRSFPKQSLQREHGNTRRYHT